MRKLHHARKLIADWFTSLRLRWITAWQMADWELQYGDDIYAVPEAERLAFFESLPVASTLIRQSIARILVIEIT